MEQNFLNLFKKNRHERRIVLLLSLEDPDILKQSKFTDHEMDIIKKLALGKLHGQNCFREYFALSLLE